MRPLEPGMPGVLAVHVQPCGDRRRVAECARCWKVLPIRGRGLCAWCRKLCRRDGTLKDWGWTKGDRLADYRAARAGGLGVPEAAARAGVAERTGWRYEAALREAS